MPIPAEQRTRLDPKVDEAARLWQHLTWVEFGIRKSVIDPATQHCRPAYVPIFVAFLDNARGRRLTARQLIDQILIGARILRRQAGGSITLPTARLAEKYWIRFMLDVR
jgi:hypothetical protein